MARAIARRLVGQRLVTGGTPDLLAPVIEAQLLDELMVEDRLNAEVKRLMAKYEAQIAGGEIDSQKMFQMIKKKLVEERGIVL